MAGRVARRSAGGRISSLFIYDTTLLISTVVCAVVAYRWFRSPASSIFHPATFYLAFHAFIFVFRPILSRVYDYRFVYKIYEFQPSEWDRIEVILGANLAFLVFMWISARYASQPMVFLQDRHDDMHRRLMIGPFLAVSTLLVPLALYAAVETWLTTASGTSTMVYDAATRVRVNTQGSGYLFEFQLVLATISVMFAWLFRFRLWSLIPFLLFFLLRAGTGGRGPFVVASVMMILLFLYDQRRRWPEMRSVVLAITAIAMFSFVVVDRGAAVRELFIQDNSANALASYDYAPLEGMDFANMEYFEYLTHTVPEKTGGYDYFVNLLQVFTEPVPRALWKGKPAGPPISFFNLFDYGNPLGMTPSLPGYGWFSLGWFGIAIVAAAFAGFYAWLHRRLMRNRQANFTLLTSIILTSITVITFRDGGLLSMFKMCLFYFLPLVLTYAAMRVMGLPTAAQMRAWSMRSTARPDVGETTEGAAGARPASGKTISGETAPARRRRLLAQRFAQTRS